MSQAVSRDGHDPVRQWVTFRLADCTYGISVLQVQEVIRVYGMAPVPGTPEWVKGVINLRGHAVTVLDTRVRFGMPGTGIDSETRILITECGNQVFGMLVDSVAEVVELNSSDVEGSGIPVRMHGFRCIDGIARINGELLALVDIHRLLSSEERSRVTNL